MTSRADLLIFSSEFPPYILGGLGTHVQSMTSALRHSWSVRVFVPERSGYASTGGIQVEEIPLAAEPDSLEFWLEYAHLAARRARISLRGPEIGRAHV